MAITSIGYAGTVTDAEWPLLAKYAGGVSYNVAGSSDFAATPGVGDRAVAIAAGTAAGAGIVDTSSAAVTVTLGTVSSGSRWDLIGLKRDWSTGASTVVVVPGSAAKAIPSRSTTPGVLDVQPLWLARVTAGQTNVQEFVDLRVWVGEGGAYAADDLVRSYLTRLGTVINIGTTTWARTLDALGSAQWTSYPQAPRASTPLSLSGWTIVGGITITPLTGSGQVVRTSLQLTRTGSNVTLSATAYTTLGVVLPVEARVPGSTRYFTAAGWNGSNWFPCVAALQPSGTLLARSCSGSSVAEIFVFDAELYAG